MFFFRSASHPTHVHKCAKHIRYSSPLHIHTLAHIRTHEHTPAKNKKIKIICVDKMEVGRREEEKQRAQDYHNIWRNTHPT